MQMKVHSPLRDCIATLETTSVLVNKMHVLQVHVYVTSKTFNREQEGNTGLSTFWL